MHNVLITPTLHSFSGIDRVVERQATDLLAAGHTVTIVTLSASLTIPGAQIIEMGIPKSQLLERIYRLFFFFDRRTLRNTAQQVGVCDVIYAHFYPSIVLGLAIKKKNPSAKLIYYNQGIPPTTTFQSVIEKIYIAIFRRVTNHFAKQADEVISISKYLQEVFEKETGKSGTFKHLPIDTNRFHAQVDSDTIRKRYDIPDTAKVALYVGRLSPHKGIHLLIQAYKKVRSIYPDTWLLIAGKPTFAAYAKELESISDDHVIFSGFVSDEDLPAFYGACDAYTTATLWEGFDLPLVEAQACGKPVIAFDIGPHKELTTTADVLVPCGDVDAFASAMQKKLWP